MVGGKCRPASVGPNMPNALGGHDDHALLSGGARKCRQTRFRAGTVLHSVNSFSRSITQWQAVAAAVPGSVTCHIQLLLEVDSRARHHLRTPTTIGTRCAPSAARHRA